MAMKEFVKQHKWVVFILLLVFLITAGFLIWDHYKYGKETPPKSVEVVRDISVPLMMISSGAFLALFLWYALVGMSGAPTWYKWSFVILIAILIAAISGWGWYHFKGRKDYPKGKQPKWVDVVHKTSMWIVIITVLILMTIGCFTDNTGFCLWMALALMA